MKRMLSLLLVCVMTIGMLGIVPVSATGESGYSKGDIDFFTSFSDFEGTNTIPQGFVNIESSSARMNGIDAIGWDTAARTSTVARIGGDKQPVIPFKTNFLDGYMHVSFDYLQTNENADTTTDRMLSVLFSRNPTENETTRSYYDVNTDTRVDNPEAWNSDEYDYTKIVPVHTMDLFGAGSKEAGIGRTLYMTNFEKLVGASNTDGVLNDNFATAEDTWYKVDMFFDRNTNRYYVYVDGVLQDYDYKYTNDGLVAAEDNDITGRPFGNVGNRAVKALIFRCDHLKNYDNSQKDSARADGYVYLDNVYVSQYNANSCTNDELKITVDTMGEKVLRNGSLINIAFSEYLDRVPVAADFKITKDGVATTDFEVVSADKAQATIKLNTTSVLDGGTYAITVENVKGQVSGSYVSNSVDVEIMKSTSANTTKYYWADEDFENLVDGVIPPNWYYGKQNFYNSLDKNKYVMDEANADYVTQVGLATGVDGGSAIEFKGGEGVTNSNNMYYFFPRGIASGDFKAEFDIKHTNGGWSFGFVNYDNYKAANHRGVNGKIANGYASKTAPTISENRIIWQVGWRMESSILLGMAKENYEEPAGESNPYNEFDASERAYSPDLGMISATTSTTEYKNSRGNINNLKKQLVKDSETEYMQIAPNQWSKVEVGVNDTSKKYTVKVTPYNADGTLNTAGAKVTEWTDGDGARYLQGIMGIRFARKSDADANTGSVFIDNVKVYKESTSYLDEDFNDYTSNVLNTNNKNKLPSGWMSFDTYTRNNALYYHVLDTAVAGVTSSEGKDGTANSGDKSMYLYRETPSLYKSLDEPIPAGKAFAVEFDIYNKGFTYKNGEDDITNGCGSEWFFMQMGKEDTQQLPGFNYAGNLASKSGKALVENLTYRAIGADDKNELINDAKVATYTPFADKTAAESYARINGNSMLENVVFGRQNDGLHFKISKSGRHSAKRGFHGSDTNINNVTDVLDQWTNYKVICEPISTTETKYTIVQTKADGTTATGTFTNTRDWMTHDTYGIGFGVPAAWHSGNSGNNGNHGTKIDNLKVYAVDERGNEANAVTHNSIESVKAINSDGTKTAEVMDGTTLPVDTKKIEVTFSEPVAEQINPTLPSRNANLPELKSAFENETEKGTYTQYLNDTTDEYTDYTILLDNIKDVVSLRKKGSQLENAYSVALTNDNKTVEITLNNATAADDTYTLGVNQNIAFEGNSYAKLQDNFVKTYTASGDFPEATPPAEPDKEEINYTKLHATVFRGTANIPVNKAGALRAGEEITTKIEKENTTDEAVKALVGYAFYVDDNSTGTRNLLSLQSQLLDIAANTDRTTDAEVKFNAPDGATSFKAFSWSYPGMKPYVELTEANVE